MAADVTIYMRLYISDWDEATADLTLEEECLYARLIRHMWKRGGTLQLDHSRLATACRVTRGKWNALWPIVRRFFMVSEDGLTFTQKRLQEEMALAKAGREQRVNAGRASAAKRNEQRDVNGRSTGVGTGDKRSYPSSVNLQPSESESPSDSCAETAKPSSAPPVLTFPVDGGDKEWALTVEHVAQLRDAFPSLDVESLCRQARAWILAKPTRRKTTKGMPAFLFNWFSNEQNRHGGKAQGPGAGGPVMAPKTQQLAGVMQRFVERHGEKGGQP